MNSEPSAESFERNLFVRHREIHAKKLPERVQKALLLFAPHLLKTINQKVSELEEQVSTSQFASNEPCINKMHALCALESTLPDFLENMYEEFTFEYECCNILSERSRNALYEALRGYILLFIESIEQDLRQELRGNYSVIVQLLMREADLN